MPLSAVRKISETIVDFGEPLIHQLDTAQPYEVVRSTFEIVVLVWNAHEMAMPRWGSHVTLPSCMRGCRTRSCLHRWSRHSRP